MIKFRLHRGSTCDSLAVVGRTSIMIMVAADVVAGNSGFQPICAYLLIALYLGTDALHLLEDDIETRSLARLRATDASRMP